MATAERLLGRVASRPLTVLDQSFATTLSIGVAWGRAAVAWRS